MADFEAIWQRIVAMEGQTFVQKTGSPFRYQVRGNSIIPSTTRRQLGRSQFARTAVRAPLRGPGQFQDLQGPSYLFAILTDPRITAANEARPRPAAAPGPACSLSGTGRASSCRRHGGQVACQRREPGLPWAGQPPGAV